MWWLLIFCLLTLSSSQTPHVQYYAQIYLYTESSVCDNNLHTEIEIVPLNLCILVSSGVNKRTNTYHVPTDDTPLHAPRFAYFHFC